MQTLPRIALLLHFSNDDDHHHYYHDVKDDVHDDVDDGDSGDNVNGNDDKNDDGHATPSQNCSSPPRALFKSILSQISLNSKSLVS